MKNFRWWPVIGMAAMAAALVGCGSDSNNAGNSNVRLINATNSHPSIDFLVNSGVVQTGVLADNVSGYAAPATGAAAIQVNDTTTGAALAASVPTLSGALHYAVVAYESGGAVQTAVLNEDFAVPAVGVAELRIFNAATDAGKLDIYITDPTLTSLATVSAPTVSFTTTTNSVVITQSPGNYKVWATAAGNKGDLRMVLPVTLTSQEFADLILTPASGGALINGGLLIQQGAYTATRNTNARVRLAAAVSGGATVAASASSGTTITTIDAGSVAPAFGFYVLVPAGSTTAATTFNISVNGASVGAPAAALTPGGDATLLVYGAPGSAVASLIADDNRPPTDGSVKMRFINGITGAVGAVTLTANTVPVGANIAAGTASSYVTIPSSLNPTNLVLTSSQSAGTLKNDATNTLSGNSVYTVFAAGDFAAPASIIILPRNQ